MTQIKISILIPTFNYTKGINKIIECLKFTDIKIRKNIEIIISDDSDKKIIDSKTKNYFIKSFGNFQYIYNNLPLGGIPNWNKLISMAQGEYYWLLHHDEYWEREKDLIKNLVNFINNQNPNFIILPIYKEKEIYFYNLTISIVQKHFSRKFILKKFLIYPKLLIELNLVGPPSSVIYKKSMTKYDTNLKYLVDVDFYIKLLKIFNGKGIFLMDDYYLFSSQNNNSSITKSLGSNIYQIKKKEKDYLGNKYKFKFKFSDKAFLFYSFIILKFNSLISTRIKIKRNI